MSPPQLNWTILGSDRVFPSEVYDEDNLVHEVLETIRADFTDPISILRLEFWLECSSATLDRAEG